MKKKLSTVLLVLVFLIGLSIFLYPKFSSYYNKKYGSYVAERYNKEVANVTSQELLELIAKAEVYNDELLKETISFVNGDAEDKNYLSQLRLGETNDVIATIKIKSIKVNLPIYHGTGPAILQSGVGHLEGSALPVGGVGNHTVLSGHTGLPSATLFTDLDKVKVGDDIIIKTLDKELSYKVFNIAVVLPDELDLIKPVADKDLVTLVTCTPYGINTHRLLVQAERQENVEDTEDVTVGSDIEIENSDVNNDEKVDNITVTNGGLGNYKLLIVIGVLIIFTIVMFIVIRKKVKNTKQ